MPSHAAAYEPASDAWARLRPAQRTPAALVAYHPHGNRLESTDCFRRRQHCDLTCRGATQRRSNALRRGGVAHDAATRFIAV